MIDVQALVGPRQQGRFGQFADLGAIGRHTFDDGGLAVGLGRAVLPAGDPDTGHQPAQVPLPAARVGFVEIVEVDDQVALGGGIEAEVAQVGVTADDRRDPGRREVGHVFGHHDRGATQEAVGGRDHSPDADRDQPVETALVRVHDLQHRVGSADRWCPVRQRGPRDPLPQFATHAVPVRPCGRSTTERGEGVTVGTGQHDVAGRSLGGRSHTRPANDLRLCGGRNPSCDHWRRTFLRGGRGAGKHVPTPNLAEPDSSAAPGTVAIRRPLCPLTIARCGRRRSSEQS